MRSNDAMLNVLDSLLAKRILCVVIATTILGLNSVAWGSKQGLQSVPKTTEQTPKAVKIKKACQPVKLSNKLPDGRVNTPYKNKIVVSGGIAPFFFKKASDSTLPKLKLSTNGTLSGVFAKPGTYRLPVEVRDSCSSAQTVKKTLEIIIRPVPVQKKASKNQLNKGVVNKAPTKTKQTTRKQTTDSPTKLVIPKSRGMECKPITKSYGFLLGEIRTNIPYKNKLKNVYGGRKPLSYSPASRLPPGLNITSEGVLFGVPTKPGHYRFDIRITDSCIPNKQSKIFVAVLKVALNLRREDIKITEELPIGRPGDVIKIAEGEPIIESLFSVPLGSLIPLTKLYIKGRFLGKQPGSIILRNEQGRIAKLENLNWKSQNEIDGIVPESTKFWENQTVTLQVKTVDKKYSNKKEMEFTSLEEKWLSREDIQILHCGSGGNADRCNHIFYDGKCTVCADKEPNERPKSGCWKSMDYQKNHGLSVYGFHCNTFLTLEDDSGVDRYRVTLKNGWVIKNVEYFSDASEWDEVYLEGPVPRYPTGQSDWTFDYAWSVTPCDQICYGLNIKVEGPAGTNYK